MADRLLIIGAGMAGLLAANMLRRHDPVVLESKAELPNNHSAVLRFGSSAVADVLGIPFRRVNLVKTVLPWRNQVADALAYSKKNLGRYESDRSLVRQERTSSSLERWVAPPDLIAQMARGIEIKFDTRYDFGSGVPKVISTVPMPVLMQLLDYPCSVEFRHVGGVNVTARVRDCDAFVSLLVPDPGLAFSRVSVTGDLLIVEFPGAAKLDFTPHGFEEMTMVAAALLGFSPRDLSGFKVAEQAYHKIAPIDEVERKEFIHWASVTTGRAWQLGRFATWRPKLQLDDLVSDVRTIERWMVSPSSSYEMEFNRRRA